MVDLVKNTGAPPIDEHSPRVWARFYTERGYAAAPLRRRSKKLLKKGLPKRTLREEEIAQHFSKQINVGLRCGEPSGHLIDIDVDASEALMLAPAFLPATEMRHGRESKPSSHLWFTADTPLKSERFCDVDGTVLVEIRSTGSITMVPPSVHPGGERLQWETIESPSPITADELRAAVQKLAAATLVARHWPKKGIRHHASLALAGLLLRSGVTEADTQKFMDAALRQAGDEEWLQRRDNVFGTARTLDQGRPATGGPALAKLLGKDGPELVRLLQHWLGLTTGGRSGSLPAEGIPSSPHYEVTPHGLIWMKRGKDADVRISLTNFTAKILTDIAEDDGTEVRHIFELEARLGDRIRQFRVSAAQFASMKWPTEHLGVRATVYPGFGLPDHARAAIQLLSPDVVERQVYLHSGWRQIENAWAYLHARGAIGPTGPIPEVEVSLPPALAGLTLPEPPTREALVRALQSSLEILDVAPDRITFPLYAAIARAVIAPADFSLHLAGQTGVGKTALAAVIQEHFGQELDAAHLPASWSSTANALEGLAFYAKDALLVVDDFAPSGAQADVQRFHRDADRLLRAQGNLAGRQRMRPDGSLRPPKPPRGLIVSTGEDVPRGQSLRARILILEMKPDDLDWVRLTDCQIDAGSGRYAQALAGFLQWLAPQYPHYVAELQSAVVRRREEAIRSETHRRIPTITAHLLVALDFWLEYAVHVGAITPADGNRFRERARRAFAETARAQEQQQRAAEPAQRFVELLQAAIASGRAHVANVDGTHPKMPEAWGWRAVIVGSGDYARQEWHPQGDRVGWLDDDNLYFEPEASFAVVQRLGRDTGDSLPVASKTLHKRLHEKGLLASTDVGRRKLTVRRMLERQRRAVLHFQAGLFSATARAQ